MTKTIIIIIVCIFIGVGVFSFSKAISLFKMNESLISEINNTYKPKIDSLEKENTKINTDLASAKNSLANLEEENNVIKSTLRSKEDTLKQLQIALERKDKALSGVTEKSNDLENENNLLKDKISSMFLEFSEMKKTFSSIKALHQRIKELKKKKKIDKEYTKERLKQREPLKKDVFSQTDINNTNGNRGFLIRDGKSTYIPKLRIVVTPVEG